MASITYWPLDRHVVIIADYDVASVIVDVYDTLWWCSVILPEFPFCSMFIFDKPSYAANFQDVRPYVDSTT